MKIHLSTPSRVFVVIVLTLGMAGVPLDSAKAVTCTVNTNADGTGPIPAGSLREKIADASCSTIIFAPSLSGGIIELTSMLSLGHNVSIDGSALASMLSISAEHASGRAFQVSVDVTASLNSLRIAHGNTTNGAGIYNSGTLTVANTTLQNNLASLNGAGIYNDQGTLTISHSIFNINSASGQGGAVYSSGGDVTVTDSTLQGNGSSSEGAGIYALDGNLTVTNVTFKDNQTNMSPGGGIYFASAGNLSVTDSTFDSNLATPGGAGIELFSGEATVTTSTFTGNTSSDGAGAGIDNQFANLTVVNSTFRGNNAIYGSGIYNFTTLNLTNSTFSGNTASPTEGGADVYNLGTLNFANNILANAASGADCLNDGTIGTNTHNLVTDGTCSPAYISNPNLGPLANNGGPTQTMALPYSSPAIDHGDSGSCPVTDQRGVSRRGVCDIGAYEYIPPVACKVTTTADSGAGSLREQIANPSCSTITFDSDLAGFTILLSSELVINRNMTIDGSALAAHIIISGAGTTRVFYVGSSVTVTLMGLTIANGYALVYGQYGAAIFISSGSTVNVSASTLTGNTAIQGGAIYNFGTLTVTDSLLQGNYVTGPAGYGGGIYSDGVSLTITHSTLKENSASQPGGGLYIHSGLVSITGSTFASNSAVNGGGIGIENASSVTVNTSTFAGNDASADGWGGAIMADSTTLNVTDSTFSANSAYGGGGIYTLRGTLNLKNSTLSGNTASSTSDGGGAGIFNIGTLNFSNNILDNPGSYADCLNDTADGAPPFTTNVKNLVEVGYCLNNADESHVPVDVSGDPLLGPLADNGGPTQTMALLTGSPAIDAGLSASCPATDQRGVPRPQGMGCDIGAYEVQVILYAAPGGLTTGLCESWAHACELRYALTSSVSGQEIWVKAGTYNPTGGTERTATFQLKDGVALYGGFAGSEMVRGQRNPAGYQSILSGEIGAANTADNSYHVVTGATGATGAILDGFTVTGGNANGAGAYNSGGGVYNTGILAVTGVTFSGNTAYLEGGAVYNVFGATLHIMGSTFNGNSANHGGAVSNQGTLEVKDSTFSSNQAEVGGAIESTHADLTVKSSTFSGNQAADRGGAIDVIAGSFELSNSTLQGNSATKYGGGINHEHGNMWIMSSTLSGNSVSSGAGYFGGGIADQYAVTLYMANTIIANSTYGGDCHSQLSVAITSVNNLVQDGSCSAGLTGDPLLGPLADNGGPTQTMALLSGSPAINAGNNAACAAEPVYYLDQRGMTRLVGPLCDIGAYEVNTLYATPGGATTGSCDSWASACKLPYALSISISGQEIWAAAGTYKPTPATDRSATFQLKQDVALYGGFAGTETARSQRNPALHVSIMSGDIDNNDSQTPIITNLATVTGNTNNSIHVVTGVNGAILDGFTITAGSASIGSSCPGTACGGGMYNVVTQPTVTNVSFIGNKASLYGGGMYNYSASPRLTNVTFSGNKADESGGGMTNWNGSEPKLTNVTFSGNTSGWLGGGMKNYYSVPTLTNVTFSGNSAVAAGGGVSNENFNPIFRNTIFWGNTAPSAAQIHNISSSPEVSDSVVQDGYAGGTHILTANPLLGVLANNGGFTQTLPLLAGSSAIDTGNDAVCPTTDQRGRTRPQGAHCDMGAYESNSPTEVSLVSFTAQVEKTPAVADGRSVILSWETSSEFDNLGFNLYRSTALDGARVKLNAGLIPTLVPPGSQYGAVYNYTDTSLMDGKTYYYWLEAVDIHGGKELTGPVWVKLVAGKNK